MIMYVSIFKTDVILYKLVHAHLIREALEALTVQSSLQKYWNHDETVSAKKQGIIKVKGNEFI